MRRLAIAVLASLCSTALADPALVARPDSALVQHTLDRPFRADFADLPLVVEILRQSGNEQQAEILERVEMVARVGVLLGEVPEFGTVREAIASDATARPVPETTARALARVHVVRPEGPDAEKVRPPPGAQAIAPGVWKRPDATVHDGIHIPLAVRNGLALPLESIGTGVGSCRFEPSLAPGETRVVMCTSGLPVAGVEAFVRAFEERKPPYSVTWIGSAVINVSEDEAYLERGVDWRTPARAQLASARCEDKGSCGAKAAPVETGGSEARRGWIPIAATALAMAFAIVGFIAFRAWRRSARTPSP